MKHTHLLLTVISASSLLCLPAIAQTSAQTSAQTPTQTSSGLQGSERIGAGPGTQAMVFIRIPLGEPRHKGQGPRMGFGLFTGCGASLGLASERNREACDSVPGRSLEFSTGFNHEPWALSFGSAGHRIDFASWSPQTGALSLAEDAGSANWVWLGLGAVAVVGVAAALSGGSDSTLCPDGFVSTPLDGTCRPIS